MSCTGCSHGNRVSPYGSLLDWDSIQTKLPWNVIILLGSGFALSAGARVRAHHLTTKLALTALTCVSAGVWPECLDWPPAAGPAQPAWPSHRPVCVHHHHQCDRGHVKRGYHHPLPPCPGRAGELGPLHECHSVHSSHSLAGSGAGY